MKEKEASQPWSDCRSVSQTPVERGLEVCTIPGHVPDTPQYTPKHTPTARWPPKVSSNRNYFRILLNTPENPSLCSPEKNIIPCLLVQDKGKKEDKKKHSPSKIIIIKHSCSYGSHLSIQTTAHEFVLLTAPSLHLLLFLTLSLAGNENRNGNHL